MEKKKAAFLTLGCKVNLYDTEAMEELFEQKGYEIVDFDSYADIYLINTCTVTNFGDKKSRQSIRRARRNNENAIVIAAGCYAQAAVQDVKKIEGVNIILGTQNRGSVVEIAEGYNPKDGILVAVEKLTKDFEPLKVSSLKNRTRAYIKIQEGCNRYCTYCIIPFARGPVRSRDPEDVYSEVERLAKKGFKEVVLTGIHVASYGIDLKNTDLTGIIKKIHNIDGIERIRLSSVEPKIITDEFIGEIKRLPKVCPHYHLSLQSGCDRTLKRMNRRYTADEYYEAVIKLRNAFPDVGITTDIIVGFPGETEEDFNESCEFAKKVRLSKIHVFPYSPKKGTAAEKFENQLPNSVKSQRSSVMCKISEDLSRRFIESLKGKIMPVLFERCIGDNIYEGHTPNYITIHAASDSDVSNCIKNTVIEDYISEETAHGTIIQEEQNENRQIS